MAVIYRVKPRNGLQFDSTCDTLETAMLNAWYNYSRPEFGFTPCAIIDGEKTYSIKEMKKYWKKMKK
ncbi:MAG: hypothetical protein PVH64_10340 [Bacillota bacterium]|jgi:hypothetical protein